MPSFTRSSPIGSRRATAWLDWFTVHEHPANAYDHGRPPGYEAWVGLHALPKLNTDNPQVREYLMRVGEYWIRKGIDGWRLDVPSEIGSEGFWQEFRQRIKAINPEAYLVGEVWGDSRQWHVAEVPRRIEIPPTDPLAQPATPTILFTTDGSPTAEPTPGGLVLTLPARTGGVFDASPIPDA